MKTSAKRILFIMQFPPPVHGAAVVSQSIHDSSLINDSFCCDYINLSTSRSVTEINRFGWKKIHRFAKALFLTFWKLITRKYDLCYIALTCHGHGFLKDAPFALLCKVFGRPLVIHQHNKGMSADVDRWPYRWLLPLVYNNSKVILLSRALYPDIASIVPEENVLICPNGIQDSADPSRTDKRDSRDVELLFISNLVASKGVLDLVEACRILKERGEAFSCRIIGNESRDIRRTDLEDVISRAGLNGTVRYDGPLYGQDKYDALDNAGIFVFPSLDECFPLCVLEAMSHSLPVVTTNEGGIPDMVRHGVNGLICAKKDPEALADAVSKLIGDSGLRAEMGKRGRELYERCFTPDIFEKNLIECLSNVAR